MLDLLCQKLADQALHFKDLVKEAIEPGVGMAKPGAECNDQLTPTSENGSSDYSSSTDQDHNDSDSSQGPSSESQEEDAFPIMQLPVEVYSSFHFIHLSKSYSNSSFYSKHIFFSRYEPKFST